MTAALKTPIAGGEYLYGIAPFRQMISAMPALDRPAALEEIEQRGIANIGPRH